MNNLLEKLPFELSTLVDILRWRALHQPEQKVYIFLNNGEVEESYLTYADLDRQARAIASWLQSLGMTGERALLLYSPSLEYIAGFFGCLYAGVIAVPAYPPQFHRPMPRLQAILANAQATLVLTTKQILTNVEEHLFPHSPELKALRWLATDSIPSNLEKQWQEPILNSDTLAFLQYTSGSTGTPKGVMITHGNLLHNEQIIQQAMQHTDKTIFVGWLPLFHDMGLIGNILQPLYLGIPCFLMPPVAFIQRPFRWLQAISKYKATTSGGPNFAYDLCVRKITPEQRQTLDLSSWEVAFNGSEPIRAETIEQFATTFAPCGFRREAFYPCYGMAESTLFISGELKTNPPEIYQINKAALEQNQIVITAGQQEDVRKFVSSGQGWLDQKIMIVDPESLTKCPDNRVGEIWISSPSVAQGYWGRVEETKKTFHAYTSDTNEGPFLRTGDLGFLQDGKLFITGRLKDVIIIRGRNYYPQDIELTVERSHPSLKPNGGAAFTVEVSNQERLVIVHEVERRYLQSLDIEQVVGDIRQEVALEYELQVYAVVLVKPGSIPKTSSGKIQRYACRANFLDGTLDSLAKSNENSRFSRKLVNQNASVVSS
ncbi:fatty acyl-AMP ligase [Nostoc sp. UHCC 0302]|uniref:fatty acyl-AMP ligase n=1 Tax=Nostoc sp. UHCC 0302 TaxID=3134896 RepID=UPI00311CC8ED